MSKRTEDEKRRKRLIEQEFFNFLLSQTLQTTQKQPQTSTICRIASTSVRSVTEVRCIERKENDLAIADDLIGNRFRIVGKLREGGFGQIYKAKDTSAKKETIVAVKLEFAVEKPNETNTSNSTEAVVLSKFQSNVHCPRIYAWGNLNGRRYVAMELLGKNLSELRQRCSLDPKRLSIGTAHRIVLQMLEAVEGLHQTGFIHKDIKPANFVTGGRAENRYTFYLVDFDQSRSYLNADGTHKPYAERVRFSGTYRYASVSALEFKEQSRRDDLHSLFYAYFEMLLGDLPWRKFNVHKTVLRMKQLHTLEKLARRMPDEAVETAKYLTTLTYESKPDYPALTNLLKNALKRYNVKPTDPFDWHIVPDCTKLQHWSTTPT